MGLIVLGSMAALVAADGAGVGRSACIPRRIRARVPAGIPRSGGVGAGFAAVRHVFILVLENQSFGVTFGKSPAGALPGQQPGRQGRAAHRLLRIGHWSLDNYLALISGQAPNPETQAGLSHGHEFSA